MVIGHIFQQPYYHATLHITLTQYAVMHSMNPQYKDLNELENVGTLFSANK